MSDVLFGETGGQHPLARWIDHRETYGPHVIKDMISQLTDVNTVVDLGAGSGRDLAIVKEKFLSSKTIAVEAGHIYAEKLHDRVDQVHILDIEKDQFPFEENTIDLFIANQVLEHTKEVFWIFDQVSKSLRDGGYFLFGVPNIASLHNRILLLFGVQPTQHKLCSAHVRPFSKLDTVKFIDACFPGGYRLVDFAGSQFYPFPAKASRIISRILPTLSFSIFFLLQKQKKYSGEFVAYPSKANLETNFWVGNSEIENKGQYLK
jgi:SAM-dependent methyltransferase